MRTATLGPNGTYSVQAAKTYDSEAELVLCNNIQDVIHKVLNDQADRGIVPLENSIHGIVAESLDSLAESNLLINDELVVDIHHVLCAINNQIKPEEVRAIYSHPQALSQCKEYIASNYPQAELITSASTAAAIKSVANKKDEHLLAVGSEFAAKQYGLSIVDQGIEDEKGNQTRFVVFSKKPTNQSLPFILMAVEPEADRPGLLYDLLGIIKHQSVNMLQIDSRPNRSKLGSHIFYIRLQLNSDDTRFDNIVEEANKIDVIIRRMSL